MGQATPLNAGGIHTGPWAAAASTLVGATRYARAWAAPTAQAPNSQDLEHALFSKGLGQMGAAGLYARAVL